MARIERNPDGSGVITIGHTRVGFGPVVNLYGVNVIDVYPIGPEPPSRWAMTRAAAALAAEGLTYQGGTK